MMIASIVVLISLLFVVYSGTIQPSLNRYNIKDVSVSGLSSGGYMAVQLHIAHSHIVNGSAIYAAGPWYCSQGSLVKAQYNCMTTKMGRPPVQHLVDLTLQNDGLGLVDSVLNLKHDRIYLYSGQLDSVVSRDVVLALENYYKYFLEDYSLIVADYAVDAEHSFPTLDFGSPCPSKQSPYLNNCQFDGAGSGLQTIYENTLKSPYDPSPLTLDPSLLQPFDQTPYTSQEALMDSTGYLFVPENCSRGGACSLHISFHGCMQGRPFIGDTYALHSGFLPWAQANDIIVLFPYVTNSSANPQGCWDWWGYTGPDFALKTGPQIASVKNMIDALVEF